MFEKPSLATSGPLENERGQAKVRVAICLGMGTYFALVDLLHHPLYLFFVAYSGIALVTTLAASNHSKIRVAATLLVDFCFTYAGLYFIEEYGLFLFILSISVTFGYALRFGRMFLWIAVATSTVGVINLHLWSAYWGERPFDIYAYLLGVPFIALYIDHLTSRLRHAVTTAEALSDHLSEITLSVSHDVRTQLHSILVSVKALKAESRNKSVRVLADSIEAGVIAIADITSQILEAKKPKVERSNAVTSGVNSVDIYAWIGTLARRFAEPIRRSNSAYLLDLQIERAPLARISLTSCERIASNMLSNSVRYIGNGHVRITMSLDQGLADGGKPETRLVVRVENTINHRGSKQFTDDIPLSGSGLGLSGCKALASSLGGSFSFSELPSGEFVTEFSIPLESMGDSSMRPPCRPIVCISTTTEVRSGEIMNLANSLDVVLAETISPLVLGAFSDEVLEPVLLVDQELLGHSSREIGSIFETVNAPDVISIGNQVQFEQIRGSYLVTSTRDAALESIKGALRSVAPFEWRRVREKLVQVDSLPLVGMRLAVVDDNAFNREMLTKDLVRNGATVREFSSVDDVTENLDSEFDAVITDWFLNDAVAVDLIKWFQARGEGHAPLILVLSSHSAFDISSELKKMGGAEIAVLQKPHSLDSVLQHLVAADKSLLEAFEAVGERANRLRLFDASVYSDNGPPDEFAYVSIELVQLFLTEVTKLVHRFAAFRAEFDEREMLGVIHQLKGVCESGGALACAEICTELYDSFDDYSRLSPFGRNRITATLELFWLRTKKFVELQMAATTKFSSVR